MKKILSIICLIVFIVILVKTNPTQEDFEAHLAGIQSKAVTQSGDKNGFGGALTEGVAAIAKGLGFLSGALREA